jgi:copper chaperone CopZ
MIKAQRDEQGYPTGGITPTETVDEAKNIINEAGGKSVDDNIKNIEPLDATDVSVDDMDETVTEDQPQNRAQQVKDAIKKLSDVINEVTIAVYQMKLTEAQIQELTNKLTVSISDTISDITIERVKDIAPEILGAND